METPKIELDEMIVKRLKNKIILNRTAEFPSIY